MSRGFLIYDPRIRRPEGAREAQGLPWVGKASRLTWGLIVLGRCKRQGKTGGVRLRRKRESQEEGESKAGRLT